jgi:ComF family protein
MWPILCLVLIIISVNIARPKQARFSIKRAGTFALQGLNQLLWPPVCANCRQSICETDHDLCQDCWDGLVACTGADYCRRCGREASPFGLVEGSCPDCQGKEMRFDRIARTGIYSRSLQEMILTFKKGRTELASVLAFLANSALETSDFYTDIEFFVPVPLHWSRRLMRGYNQSQVLAGKLKHPSARINMDLLRIRRTRLQPAMATAAARARNVAGAFAVRRGHPLAGRKICLVDDIKTSGATLNECASVLKQAGAAKVFALVLAVAGQKTG